MDNERAKFQQVLPMPLDVYWSADSRKYKEKIPDASFIVVRYGTKWDANDPEPPTFREDKE